MSILDEIFAHKRTEVAAAKQALSEAELERQAAVTPTPPDFAVGLRDDPRSFSGVYAERSRSAQDKPAPRLIAEVKHCSPSKGLLCEDFDPLRLARTYVENGAAAISVLTDEKYFGGSLGYLRQIAALGFGVPLLRKDFVFDRYQLLEARAAGASAALLIVAMLSQAELTDLIAAAHDLQLASLVEVHSRPELERALEADAKVIGVNNRDLHTFTVSLETTLRLRTHIPSGICVVAESGIHTPEDVARLAAADVDAILVGEALVTAPDIAGKVRSLARHVAGLEVRT